MGLFGKFNFSSGFKKILSNTGYLFGEKVFNMRFSLKKLAETVQQVVSHKGESFWDATKPDGTPRKLMDVLNNKLGWEPKYDLQALLEDMVQADVKFFKKDLDLKAAGHEILR
jgi:nucleoside-diphosphate-sugar epimerase